MSYQPAKTIADAVSEIYKGNYVLPSIQREFVWSDDQIERLFDSIMREYPIGAFLFWKLNKQNKSQYKFYEFLSNYHQQKSTHNKPANLRGESGVTAVLDGQQRLTSIYLGLKGTYATKLRYKRKNNSDAYPVRTLYLDLLNEEKDEDLKYNFKFLSAEQITEFNNSETKTCWFEVGKILETKSIEDVIEYSTKYINNDKRYTEEQQKNAFKTLCRLHQVIHMSASISYYEDKHEELEKVLNIFIRVNSGGTILSYSDLLLSIASAQWKKHDAREELIAFVDDVNEIGNKFNITKDFVLKAALVLSDLTNIAFKVSSFNKTNMAKIENNWEQIKKAIALTVQLVSDFGYSKDNLSSYNALIPIAYYFSKNNLDENFLGASSTAEDRIKIKQWLARSLVKRVFSGQPDNVLRPIRKIIKEKNNGFPLNEITDYFKGSNKTIAFTEEDIDLNIMDLEYGDQDVLSSLILIYPSYDKTMHIDHIYPKSLFKVEYLQNEGLSKEEMQFYIENVHNIANLQLLDGIENIKKQNKEFDQWFDEQHKTEAQKDQFKSKNYIPDINYNFKNYKEFIKERGKLLKNAFLRELL